MAGALGETVSAPYLAVVLLELVQASWPHAQGAAAPRTAVQLEQPVRDSSSGCSLIPEPRLAGALG